MRGMCGWPEHHRPDEGQESGSAQQGQQRRPSSNLTAFSPSGIEIVYIEHRGLTRPRRRGWSAGWEGLCRQRPISAHGYLFC